MACWEVEQEAEVKNIPGASPTPLWITRDAEFTDQASGTNRPVGKIPKPANPIVYAARAE